MKSTLYRHFITNEVHTLYLLLDKWNPHFIDIIWQKKSPHFIDIIWQMKSILYRYYLTNNIHTLSILYDKWTPHLLDMKWQMKSTCYGHYMTNELHTLYIILRNEIYTLSNIIIIWQMKSFFVRLLYLCLINVFLFIFCFVSWCIIIHSIIVFFCMIRNGCGMIFVDFVLVFYKYSYM
jgi:hypothetical protein